MPDIKVTKLDAATGQLRTAIQMFFKNADSVSIHTLACAAQEILESLCKAKGIKSLKSGMIDLVRPEMKAKFIKITDEAQNSFKHAGKDPKATTTFNPETTELVLWDAVILHNNLTSLKDPLFVTFNLWLYAKDPKIFALSAEQKSIYNSLTKGFDYKNRKLFLDMAATFM